MRVQTRLIEGHLGGACTAAEGSGKKNGRDGQARAVAVLHLELRPRVVRVALHEGAQDPHARLLLALVPLAQQRRQPLVGALDGFQSRHNALCP